MYNSSSHLEPVSGYTPEDLKIRLNLKQSYRSMQIFKWIAQGKFNFSEMTNISDEDKLKISKNFCVINTKVEQVLKDPDGTIKLLITTWDGYGIETVLLTDIKGRKTACVSCQIGCPMKCAFCQTGQLGFIRNLEPNEIVEQFLHLERIVGTLDNIVFMGMGEPLLNIESIRKTIDILCHKQGRALSKRRITLSTSGLAKEIKDLADNGPEVRLAVSLTVANDAIRSDLMPVNKTNSLSQLKESLIYYAEKTQKRISLELALLENINTSYEHAEQLYQFTKDLPVHLNLIPWNPVESLPYTRPSNKEINQFYAYLEDFGINVTIRKSRGTSIGGACGQLGRSVQQ